MLYPACCPADSVLLLVSCPGGALRLRPRASGEGGVSGACMPGTLSLHLPQVRLAELRGASHNLRLEVIAAAAAISC